MRIAFGSIVVILTLGIGCRSQSRPSTVLTEVTPESSATDADCALRESAMTKIANLTGMTADPDLAKILENFCTMRKPKSLDVQFSRLLLDELMAQKWGGEITDYLATADLLFQDRDQKFKDDHQSEFLSSTQILERLRAAINTLIKVHHPGYSSLNATELRKKYQGSGINVAVFDVFDDDLLSKQRGRYPNARIESAVRFGNPVALNHGNIVIDILLELAPSLTIIPVSASNATYNNAMQYLADRRDIAVVNMSRALLGTTNDAAVDASFAAILDQISGDKIVVKALGNTGADLAGTLSPRRKSAGLGPVGDLTTYDSRLILSYMQHLSAVSKAAPYLLFSESLSTFGDFISLTATIPGSSTAVQQRTVAAAADGIFSWSSDNFESGSSFAAPQVTAITALLLEACIRQRQTESAKCLDPVWTATKSSAQRPQGVGGDSTLSAEEVGLGRVDGDRALGRL